MTRNTIIAIVIIGLVLVGGIMLFIFLGAPTTNPPVTGQAFDQTGILTKDNPGRKPGVWYLTYEKPGSAALSAELDTTAVTAQTLYNGQTARVQGTDNNGVVKVTSLQVLNANKDDLIWVATPLPNQVVSSPLTVTGHARGNWYFEANFPIRLLDANGKELTVKPVQAQGEWMTTNYVPFTVTLTFAKPSTATGTLVLEKDNPSGLPEHANELRIPVRFEAGGQQQAVKLYYYDPNKDKDASGNIKCSKDGLVAVNRQIAVTQIPIQETIALLLQGPTQQEKSQGITSEFPLAGVSLKGANLQSGVLTLEFADPQNKTGGGSCRVAVLWAQIEATAKQFTGVASVKFIPEELFQP